MKIDYWLVSYMVSYFILMNVINIAVSGLHR